MRPQPSPPRAPGPEPDVRAGARRAALRRVLRMARSARHYGIGAAASMAAAAAATALFPGAFRRLANPRLSDLNLAARAVDRTADRLAAEHLPADDATIAHYVAEHDALRAHLERRHDGRRLATPASWAVEPQTSCLLYLLVRILRPATVVETGVANGWSTCVLLQAVDRNGAGTVHSIDVRPDAGSLLSAEQRSRWSFHRLRAPRPAGLAAILDRIPPVHLFLHDSDHSYPWQRLEYATAAARLAPGGVLASDDVDGSYAFVDFCRAVGRRPLLLVGRKKVAGVLLDDADHGADGNVPD